MPYRAEVATAVAAQCTAGAMSDMQLSCAHAAVLMQAGSTNIAAMPWMLPVLPTLLEARSGLLLGLKLDIPKPFPGSCAALDIAEVTRLDAADPNSDMLLSRAVALLLAMTGSCVVRSLAWSMNLDTECGEDAAPLSSSSEKDMLSELLSEPAATEKEVGHAEEEAAKNHMRVIHCT